VQQALGAGSKRLLGTYLQALLAYPDGCTHGEVVLDPSTNEVLAHAPALPGDRLYPKERTLVELVRRERDRNRRVLVYVTHTKVRDITPRLRSILEQAGFHVAVLKADTVTAERREEWVSSRVREGVDVLVTNPRLVQTGLDLVDFPSVVWMEIDYSVYVLRQASRRSWRIGQRQPVEVTFLAYAGTLQADALSLVAAKTRASLMVEGELPEEGLAALDGDGGDVFLELARRLLEPADNSDSHERSLEALFAEARRGQSDGNDLLVEGVWEEVEVPQGPTDFSTYTTPNSSGAPEELPLFATVNSTAPPESAPLPGKVVSFEELAQLVRRRRTRSKRIPEGQLSLFRTDV
jgi:hypothetical protein